MVRSSLFVLFCADFRLFVSFSFGKNREFFFLLIDQFGCCGHGGREGRQAVRVEALVLVEIVEFSWEREYVNKWEIDEDDNERDIKECVFSDTFELLEILRPFRS